MTNTEQFLKTFYLEFLNDYLTIDHFAEHKGITPETAKTMVNEGKVIHEFYVEHWKNSVIKYKFAA